MSSEENNGFGPVYKPRGDRAKYAAVAVLGIAVVTTCVLERSGDEGILQFYMKSTLFSLFAWIVGQTLSRVFLFVEEVFHRQSRYQGDWKKALKSTVFDYQNKTLLLLIVSTGILLAISLYFNNEYDLYKLRLFFLNAATIPAFLFVLDLSQPPKITLVRANEKENKNLADGLAWNLYFNYLKFVLPNLQKQIMRTEKYRGLKVKKMFILIPKNCVLHNSISNEYTDPRKLIELDGSLEALKINRGGVPRVYQNRVHSITDETTDEKHYCIVEYPNNMSTLYDMSNDENSAMTREEKEAQVILYATKLKEILDRDPKCEGTYELVLFRGDQELSKIMLRALKDCSVTID